MSTEFEQKILEQLREIRELVTAPRPQPTDLVDAQYIASRAGLSLRTVMEGKAGTSSLPRVLLKTEKGGRRLVRYQRSAVDDWLRKLCKEAHDDTTQARVLSFIERERKTRRKRA